MSRRFVIAIGCALAALAIWFLVFRGGDEQRVRELLGRLASAAEVSPGENPVLRATRVRSVVVESVAPDVSFEIAGLSEPGRGRDALVALAAQAPQLFQKAEVSLSGLRITVDDRTKPKSAHAEGDATVVGVRHGGAEERDRRHVSFRLVERDGAFRVTEVTVYPPKDR